MRLGLFATEQAGDRRIVDRRRVPALTGIRGYAACWVVLFHAALIATTIHPVLFPRERWALIGRGYLGVDLFFVLSGYVLMLTQGDALARPRRSAVRAFFAARSCRVLPLHWAVLLGVWALTSAIGGRWIAIEPDGWPLFGQNLLLVQSWLGNPLSWNTPAWSLSAEWLAYLAFPLLAPVVARAGTGVCGVGIAATGALLAVAAGLRGGSLDHVHALGLVRCLCEFPMGMLGCRLQRSGFGQGARQADRLLWLGAGLLAAALAAPRADALAPLAFLLMVMAAGADAGLAARWFGNRPAIYLGEISFSIYLLHLAWFNLTWKAAAGLVPPTAGWTGAILAVACLLLVPLCHAARRWIELPGQEAGRRLGRRRP